MRQEFGASIPHIAHTLGVSLSSASAWVRDIELTPQQRAKLTAASAANGGRHKGHERRSAACRDRRLAAQAEGRAMARRGDPLHLAGCMLYWAEGARDRNVVKFANTDVLMHRHFVRFLRECYGVPSERITVRVNCYLGNGLSLEKIESWWLEQLQLPRESLRRGAVNRQPSSSRGVHRVRPYGTLHVAVHSTDLAQSIYGALQEYIGADVPEWVDLHPPSQPIFRPEGSGTLRQ